MKRDMDLVRKILLKIEASDEGKIKLDIPDYPQDQVNLHVELMKERGLVEALVFRSNDGPERKILACTVERMTWEGHEFLDAAREDSIWDQAKEQCLEATGGLSIELLKDCLFQTAKQSLGIQ